MNLFIELQRSNFCTQNLSYSLFTLFVSQCKPFMVLLFIYKCLLRILSTLSKGPFSRAYETPRSISVVTPSIPIIYGRHCQFMPQAGLEPSTSHLLSKRTPRHLGYSDGLISARTQHLFSWPNIS